MTGFDLKVSSVSLMGTQVARALLNADQPHPIPELSSIITTGDISVPVKAFFHTSPMLNLCPNKHSDVARSHELLSWMQHTAPFFHVADAKWKLHTCYSNCVKLEVMQGLHFVDNVWNETEMAPVPRPSPEEGEQSCS